MVQLLLDARASVATADSEGRRALHFLRKTKTYNLFLYVKTFLHSKTIDVFLPLSHVIAILALC